MENLFLVGAQAQHIVVGPYRMTREEALNMAAWLVVLADPTGEKFPDMLEAVTQGVER